MGDPFLSICWKLLGHMKRRGWSMEVVTLQNKLERITNEIENGPETAGRWDESHFKHKSKSELKAEAAAIARQLKAVIRENKSSGDDDDEFDNIYDFIEELQNHV